MKLENITPTSYFWIVLGLFLLGYGSYSGYYYRMYQYAFGFVCLGIGSFLCGITNGFADYSPLGRMLFRIGLPLLLVGVLLTAYHYIQYI